MFVIVRYGDKEETIFNPQCTCMSLLSTIRERCCAEEAEIELSDESGNIKNLRETPTRYADELLSDREKLVLIRVEREADDCRYTPLLNDSVSVTEAFLAQLSNGSNGNTRPNSRRSKHPHKKSKPKPGETKDSAIVKNSKPNVATAAKPKGRLK